MNISDLIEHLQQAQEAHGDVQVRAVVPQWRSTLSSEILGGFVDDDGLCIVLKDEDYFNTNNDDDYSDAQLGDWIL